MTRKTPPFKHYPEWTEAFFWGFLRSNIRKITGKYPVIRIAKKLARREYHGDNKRQKWEYKCACCGNWFNDKQTTVDHIQPAGVLKSFEDLPGFFERLFCGIDGLQVLCKECHSAKTKTEKDLRNGKGNR